MQASQLIPAAILGRTPRRLAWLMDLYERNYRQMQQLLGSFELCFDTATSDSATDLSLQLTVIDRAPYTQELRLTYEFDAATADRHFAPDLSVRLYHDAKVAEALQMTGRPPWLSEQPDALAQIYLDEQWQRNVMLHKWLEYLLHHGHSFAGIPRPKN